MQESKAGIVEKVDVFVVGAGPIGLACAIEAKKRSLTHLVVEKGCIVNSLFRYPTHMRFFSTPELLEIGGVPFACANEKPTRLEALEYYRRVAETWELNLNLYERVQAVEGADGAFRIETDKGDYETAKVIAAIGFFDRHRPIGAPGDDLDKVIHFYQEPHPFAGQNVLIVGSGNSAVICALECLRHGSRVTMAVRGEALHEGVKYWLMPDIENRISCGDVKAYFNTKVVEIRPDRVVLESAEDGRFEIENDFVLAMTGYQPDYTFLEKIGVEFEKGKNKKPVFNEETCETTRKGLYLAGVVVGGMRTDKWFIENSRCHAQAIFDSIGAKA
jgi:thioredoxin reductase (NADPH)